MVSRRAWIPDGTSGQEADIEGSCAMEDICVCQLTPGQCLETITLGPQKGTTKEVAGVLSRADLGTFLPKQSRNLVVPVKQERMSDNSTGVLKQKGVIRKSKVEPCGKHV